MVAIIIQRSMSANGVLKYRYSGAIRCRKLHETEEDTEKNEKTSTFLGINEQIMQKKLYVELEMVTSNAYKLLHFKPDYKLPNKICFQVKSMIKAENKCWFLELFPLCSEMTAINGQKRSYTVLFAVLKPLSLPGHRYLKTDHRT